MGKVNLLDCTLRDGGYINEWNFGKKGIKAIIQKLEKTGIEMIEIGFLKGDEYNPDKSLFPDVASFKTVLTSKNPNIFYVGMLDMSSPIPLERITKNDNSSIDGIRVIFKKNKMNEAYEACEYIKKQGYKFFVNFVSTDAYTDKEFIEGIEKFNALNPDGMTIVDTFGLIKRKQFKRLVAIADHNMNEGAMLCYHAHNNLQQAFGNAEAMVEMNLSRDIVIDACVFGMGRGAGNLNLELFAEYMNDNYGKDYRIEPMLEIMDEYLVDFYKTKFWGYSLPLYLSATYSCHPNYAIYLAEKNTLSERALSDILKGISAEDKMVFNKDIAEKYYKQYLDSYYEDSDNIEKLNKIFKGKKVLLLAPGNSLNENRETVLEYQDDETITVSVNFYDDEFKSDYVFASNSRRFAYMKDSEIAAKTIVTSNVPDAEIADYIINVSRFNDSENEVYDNSGLMALKLLEALGVDEVFIAGMDGYTKNGNYYKSGFDIYNKEIMLEKNKLISDQLKKISNRMKITFITPTNYCIS